jgi:hypothetical protein
VRQPVGATPEEASLNLAEALSVGRSFVLRHDATTEPPVVKGVTGRFVRAGIEEAADLAKEAADGGPARVACRILDSRAWPQRPR